MLKPMQHKIENLTVNENMVNIIQSLGYLRNEADKLDEDEFTKIFNVALKNSVKFLTNDVYQNSNDNIASRSFLYEFFTENLDVQDSCIKYLAS